jgi:hypothetical protein
MRENLGAVIVALVGLVIMFFMTGAVSPHDVPRPFRFSLRALLVVIALVAVVMGLAIYSLKK